MNQQTTPASGANGHSASQDIFALTDEQILEIDPEPQDIEVRGSEPEGKPAVGSEARQAAAASETSTPSGAGTSAAKTEASTLDTSAQPAAPTPFSAPDDVRAIAELYPGGLTQAKTAADRARTLEEIDNAYFGAGGNSPEQVSASRAQLAQRLLREDPAAFREMVFAGLRALETADKQTPAPANSPNLPRLAQALRASQEVNVAPPFGAAAVDPRATPHAVGNPSPSEAELAAYTTFEKAANEDLERTVGSAIERTIEQALPAMGKPDGQALKGRLAAAVRQDVEKALQGDRQLGEQVTQVLSARRFDTETRAQVVRLIQERAQQLVPGATKRALNDWTQTVLAAQRNKSARIEATSARREVPAAAPVSRVPEQQSARRNDAPRPAHVEGQDAAKGRINYGRLSDEQILDL